MKIRVLQENLDQALGIVQRFRARQTTMMPPLPTYALMDAEGGRVTIAATNLEMGARVTVPAIVEEEGSIALPPAFISYARALPNGEAVEIVTSVTKTERKPAQQGDERELPGMTKRYTATVTAGDEFRSVVTGFEREDFPDVSMVEDGGVEMAFSASDLRNALRRVAVAAATNDSRPVLTGVYTEVFEESARFSAADGFRLARSVVKTYDGADSPKEGEKPATAVIIPARSVAAVIHALSSVDGDTDATFVVQKNGNRAGFVIGNVEVCTQLIGGNYPDVDNLIPQETEERVSVNLEKLLFGIRSVSHLTEETAELTPFVRMKFGSDPSAITVEGKMPEVGEAVATVVAEGKPVGDKVGLNWKYIAETLSLIDAETVNIYVTEPAQPVLFTAREYDWKFVVMPMFLQW